MNSRAIKVFIKDIKEVFSSIAIWLPMFAIPLGLSFLLPYLTVYIAVYEAPSIASRIANLVSANISLPLEVRFIQYFSINVLAPVFLTIPVFTASVIAADSFAGEKERKTAELLVSTPLSNKELILGKILASFIPSVCLSFLVFLISYYVLQYASIKSFSYAALNPFNWFIILLAAPLISLLTISIVVIVSAHVKGVKEAQQITSLLVLPFISLPFASILNIISFNLSFFIYLLIGLAILNILVISFGIVTFDKEGLVR
ncbi:MAG: ABC transporter permease [Candidatus Micrarchaeota archaeon]|nr:MAG: ABC transporter permease [Candidatus Micrarchaeota archaeon]